MDPAGGDVVGYAITIEYSVATRCGDVDGLRLRNANERAIWPYVIAIDLVGDGVVLQIRVAGENFHRDSKM